MIDSPRKVDLAIFCECGSLTQVQTNNLQFNPRIRRWRRGRSTFVWTMNGAAFFVGATEAGHHMEEDEVRLELDIMRGLIFAQSFMIESMIASHPNPKYLKAIFAIRFKPEILPESLRPAYSIPFEKYVRVLDGRIEELGG
ncbi:MAG: hypothetical protein AABP62_12640 [Planctomycetota bacterium]